MAINSARFAKDKAAPLPPLFAQRHTSIRSAIDRAINLSELRQALQRLETLGMPKEQAAAFYVQAEALEALLRTENNRLHGY